MGPRVHKLVTRSIRAHGLKLRFLAVSVGLLAIVLVTVAWLLLASVRKTAVHETHQRAAGIARQIAALCGVDLMAGNRAALHRLLQPALLDEAISGAEILSASGTEVDAAGAAIDPDGAGRPWVDGKRPVGDAPTAHPTIRVIGAAGHDSRLFEVLCPVTLPEIAGEGPFDEGDLLEEVQESAQPRERLAGWIRLLGTEAPVDRYLEQVRSRVFWLALPLLFAATILVSIVLWRTVLLPLARLREAAHRISEGDLSTRVPARRRDEVGEVTETFNTMVETLARSERELAARARELQGKNEALHQTTELLDSIIHSASDQAILGVDNGRRIVLYSEGARRTFGFPADDVLGRGIELLIPVLADEETLPDAGHGMVVLEVEGRHAGGQPIALRASCRLRTDAQGKPVGHAILARDIACEKAAAELRLRNQELERAASLKTEFLARMSHELRTPLNAVIGFSQILQDGILGPLNRDQTECLDNINESGTLLLKLINEILDLSRANSGQTELQKSTVALADLLRSCLTLIEPLAGQRCHRIVTNLPADLGEITSDEDHLRQVILNLLGNAVKFTREGGTITLGARRLEEHVEIVVADNGIGIAQEDLPVIFESFHQLEGALRREHEGSGLGLSIVVAFADLLNARVWVESTVGEGTRFTVALPIDIDRPEDCRPEIPPWACEAIPRGQNVPPASLSADLPGER